MTMELWMLIVAGILLILQGLSCGIAKNKQFNLLSSENFQRDNIGQLSGWGGRAERSVYNYVEYLPLFMILVLAAHLTGANNQWTALGAQLFVAGRVLHPVFYIFGPGPVRSLAWLLAVVGLVMIGLQL